MRAFIVTVRPGVPNRYTDSIWIMRDKAEQRAEDLCMEFDRRGSSEASREPALHGWAAWVTEIEIADAKLGK